MPDSTQSEAPISVWQAVRAERDRERLRLADEWLGYLDAEERSQLQVQRWVMAGFTTLAAGVWVGLAIESESSDRDVGITIGSAAAAAVSLGWTVATLLTSDVYAAREVGAWSLVTEFALAGIALGVVASEASCDRDCRRLYGTLATSTLVNALAIAALELFVPPIFVSKHYVHYRTLPDSDRARYAIDLLVAQDERVRTGQFVGFGAATIGSLGYGVAALTADTRNGRLAFASLAAINFSIAAVSLVVNLLQRRPSEKLLDGEPPARPEAF